MSETLYANIVFSHFLGIGPVRYHTLCHVFGSSQKAYSAPVEKLREVIGAKMAEEFSLFRSAFSPEEVVNSYKKKGIVVLDQTSPQFPQMLLGISDCPICLYVRGKEKNVSLLNSVLIGVVGTRKPTSYGKRVSFELAEQLSTAGVCVISGMAMGVDASAHWGAMKQSGGSIAVLGCGVDIPYPRINEKLYYSLIETNGLVISEFPPGRTVLPGLFVARNRIISGCAKGVVVVEGLAHSGALITARYAAEQGRDVYAVPGPITSSASFAPHMLIQQGATLITGAHDILKELGFQEKNISNDKLVHLEGLEKKVAQILVQESLIADDIAQKLQTSIVEVLRILSQLEIKGFIRKQEDGTYGIYS